MSETPRTDAINCYECPEKLRDLAIEMEKEIEKLKAENADKKSLIRKVLKEDSEKHQSAMWKVDDQEQEIEKLKADIVREKDYGERSHEAYVTAHNQVVSNGQKYSENRAKERKEVLELLRRIKTLMIVPSYCSVPNEASDDEIDIAGEYLDEMIKKLEGNHE